MGRGRLAQVLIDGFARQEILEQVQVRIRVRATGTAHVCRVIELGLHDVEHDRELAVPLGVEEEGVDPLTKRRVINVLGGNAERICAGREIVEDSSRGPVLSGHAEQDVFVRI